MATPIPPFLPAGFPRCLLSAVTLTSLSPLMLAARSRVALIQIPSFIHIGISCINYGPLIVPEIRNRSSASGRFSKESQLLSGRLACVPLHGSEAGLRIFEINRCLCCALTLSRTFQHQSRIKSISLVPQCASDIQNTQFGGLSTGQK